MEQQMDYILGDWKYFIIMDAVRYEYFKKYNPFKGKLLKVYGIASHTKTFYKHLPELKDVVLISSTPYYMDHRHKFKRDVPLWKTKWDKLRGVPPQVLTIEVIKEIRKDKDQRMFIHSLAPHFPFIGYPSFAWGKEGRNSLQAQPVVTKLGKEGHPYWVRAYEGNLALGFGGIATLLPYLCGKVIITTDHGTKWGDGFVGHTPGDTSPEIRHIPLLIINKSDCIDLSEMDAFDPIFKKWGLEEHMEDEI